MKKVTIKDKLHENPMVYTIDNFITPSQCEHLINISRNKLVRAKVSGPSAGFYSGGRTGSNCWIEHDYDEITKSICKSISDLIEVPLENAEQIQMIYYDKNQEYRQHYDGWLFDGSEKSRRNMKWGGQRIWTCLGYLNTVPEGGGTKFTKLNKEVQAKQGRILVFSNVRNGTNERHKNSEHAGCPVIEGEKWAFNLWFREKTRKCLYDYPLVEKLKSDPNPVITNKSLSILDVLNNKDFKFSIAYDISDKLDKPEPDKPKSDTAQKLESKVESVPEFNLEEEKMEEPKEHRVQTSHISVPQLVSNVLSQEEINTILNVCSFDEREKSCYWIQNTELPLFIQRIQNMVNIESQYFENICVTKYKSGIHRDHLDAYDLNSEKGKTYTKDRGQRLMTITGFLSTTMVKFPKFDKILDCQQGSILFYKNCHDNTNQRDERYIKSYQRNGDSTTPMILFNIYVREKSIYSNKILRLNENMIDYKLKEEIQQQSVGWPQYFQEQKPIMEIEFEGNYEDVLEDLYTKSISENLRIPGFKIINKAPSSYVEQTIRKIKRLRDTEGFLVSENLEKKYFIDEYNPVTIENVISPEIHSIINEYFKENIKNGVYPLGDRQANRYKILDEIITRLLHLEFLPLIEKIVGRPMEATYTYLSAYLKGTKLPPHTDRADCEFTCSYIIGKPPEANWNIYIHKTKQPIKYKGRYECCPPKEECIPVDCRENGLMIFNGTDHIHYREELEWDYYNIVLLHFTSKEHTVL